MWFVVCDICGRQSTISKTPEAARDAARKEGYDIIEWQLGRKYPRETCFCRQCVEAGNRRT